MTAQATDTLATDVNNTIVDIPMVGNPDLTENGRAEGATDSHKNWKVVSVALTYEGRIYVSEPLRSKDDKSNEPDPCRTSPNMPTEVASKAATMITDGLGLRRFSRGIGRARVLAHLKVW